MASLLRMTATTSVQIRKQTVTVMGYRQVKIAMTMLQQPSQDQDCDGVLTAQDCNDNDPSTANDMDIDGVSTTEDCDDSDGEDIVSSTLFDSNCDGQSNRIVALRSWMVLCD